MFGRLHNGIGIQRYVRHNGNVITVFDETKGPTDFMRWRREVEALANSAGSDFLAALLTALDVPQAAAYPAAGVNDDTI